MTIKKIFYTLPLAFILGSCMKQDIERSYSDVLNQNMCRMDNISFSNSENLGILRYISVYNDDKSLGIIKYDSGKMFAWIEYYRRTIGPKILKDNPKILFKLYKSSILQEEMSFDSENQSGDKAYFKRTSPSAAKIQDIQSYNPSLPTEDIWPIIKKHNATLNFFSRLINLSAFSFEISENTLNKWLNSDRIEIYIETKDRPMKSEIGKEGILIMNDFKNKCGSVKG